jgi:hypothetical protein
MNVIETSLLLGVFALLAGAYAVLYSLGRLRGSQRLVTASYVCYASQWIVAAALFVSPALALGWRLLILASCLACLRIPHMTWSYLELTHRHAE